MINTIIAEDDRYAAKYLADALTSDGRFRIVAIVRDAFEAEALCAGDTDLVLMDVLTRRRHSGLSAGRRIRERFRGAKVVIVTSLVDPDVLVKAKAGCADSLWYKDHGSMEIIDVIERTLSGENVFPDASPVIELENMLSSGISPAQL